MNLAVLSVVAAFIALAFTVISAIAAGAYRLGQHATRLTSMEQRQKATEEEARTARTEASHASAQMAGLAEKLGEFKDAINRRLDDVMRAIGNTARS